MDVPSVSLKKLSKGMFQCHTRRQRPAVHTFQGTQARLSMSQNLAATQIVSTKIPVDSPVSDPDCASRANAHPPT